MLNISFSELLVISIVALLAIGPKELPEVMRKFGQLAKKAKDFAANISDSFEQISETKDDEK
ncbi:MAG: twin-arginine translocase TatA/TatE family subunit [Alphaproteobacteria bacterium]|nr:twin-arginine translocase TatA/TatE family subunit [Alphaproteobacteria bacterium]